MNRYAWTNIGPICIIQGRWFTTAACRAKLKDVGIEIQSWARNWVPMIGWQMTNVFLPFGIDQAVRTEAGYDFSAQVSPVRFKQYAG